MNAAESQCTFPKAPPAAASGSARGQTFAEYALILTLLASGILLASLKVVGKVHSGVQDALSIQVLTSDSNNADSNNLDSKTHKP